MRSFLFIYLDKSLKDRELFIDDFICREYKLLMFLLMCIILADDL